MAIDDSQFRQRFWGLEPPREDDERDEYQRDKGRIIHSAAFRRLQAKTQVMGVGEGDFHRTRLTHSIEVAQVGEGILGSLHRRYQSNTTLVDWLPSTDLLAAACYAHDLGHPPFGHGGERALNLSMTDGGFEGNAQTLRILTRLEKYKRHNGTNPTRRLILAVLKYPAPYSTLKPSDDRPRKCYYDSEHPIVEWVLQPFEGNDAERFKNERENEKPMHRSLDCSIMEYADDIAYGVHDLEDIVGRHLVSQREVVEHVRPVFDSVGPRIGPNGKAVSLRDFEETLFGESDERKSLIGKLVNLFITSVEMKQDTNFSHPLLRYSCDIAGPIRELMKSLKDLTPKLVIQQAEVQQLEARGVRIVSQLFEALNSDPVKLIPEASWKWFSEADPQSRRVCDYVAGMTDRYAERIYERLFVPGRGSSRDEL